MVKKTRGLEWWKLAQGHTTSKWGVWIWTQLCCCQDCAMAPKPSEMESRWGWGDSGIMVWLERGREEAKQDTVKAALRVFIWVGQGPPAPRGGIQFAGAAGGSRWWRWNGGGRVKGADWMLMALVSHGSRKLEIREGICGVGKSFQMQGVWRSPHQNWEWGGWKPRETRQGVGGLGKGPLRGLRGIRKSVIRGEVSLEGPYCLFPIAL